jgi:hypothetical protein
MTFNSENIPDNWDIKVLIDEKKINQLKEIISKNIKIFEDGYTKRDVLEAFKFGKPATSIEFENGDLEKIQSLAQELEEFFFVSQARMPPNEEHGTLDFIFISRIEYLVEILKYFAEKFEGNYEAFAGVAGLLLRYTPKEIAQYCSTERMKDLKIIK